MDSSVVSSFLKHQALDILSSDESIVDVVVNQLIRGVRRIERNLDLIIDLVVDFAISTCLSGQEMDGDAAEVSFHSHKLFDAGCGSCQSWALESRDAKQGYLLRSILELRYCRDRWRSRCGR